MNTNVLAIILKPWWDHAKPFYIDVERLLSFYNETSESKLLYEIFDEAFVEGLDVFIQVIEPYHMSAFHGVASEE